MSKKTKKRFPQRNSRAALAGISRRKLLTRRVRGLKLYYKGWGYAKIGRKLGVSRQAVHEWHTALSEGRGPVDWAHLGSFEW